MRREAESLFASVDARSASGYRVRVRTRGVSVEQSRKNRGGPKRPNYTAMQMNEALQPALAAKETEIVTLFEKAMDDIADIVERG